MAMTAVQASPWDQNSSKIYFGGESLMSSCEAPPGWFPTGILCEAYLPVFPLEIEIESTEGTSPCPVSCSLRAVDSY